jgi:hypothetical protein
MKQTFDYPFIAAWGRRMGSMAYYIADQREMARKDGAPQRAIYKDQGGRWRTMDEVVSPQTRADLCTYVRERWPDHPAFNEDSVQRFL